MCVCAFTYIVYVYTYTFTYLNAYIQYYYMHFFSFLVDFIKLQLCYNILQGNILNQINNDSVIIRFVSNTNKINFLSPFTATLYCHNVI